MKIAIIRKKYVFHGGAETFSNNLIINLAKVGHEIHIFSIKWDKPPQIKNVYLHKVPVISFNSFLRDLSFAIMATLKVKNNNFDIVQSHDLSLYQDIYRAGDGCHIEWLKQRWNRVGIFRKLSILLNPYHWLILLLERIIFKGHKFKKIIAISEMVKNNIIEHYEVNEKDIFVIYNGVDLEKFHPKNKKLYREELRNLYGINEDEIVLLFVGSGFERKGLKFLIKSVENIKKPLTVLVVGKGNKKKYAKMCKNQRIIFCGPQKEIYKYYASADIFVFPTIYEPFGNVHLEALASGLPVITTKLSGASEIISHGINGFVVDTPENIDKISEYICLLMNEQVRTKISEEARKLAEKFSFEKYIKSIIDLYKSINKEVI